MTIKVAHNKSVSIRIPYQQFILNHVFSFLFLNDCCFLITTFHLTVAPLKITAV